VAKAAVSHGYAVDVAAGSRVKRWLRRTGIAIAALFLVLTLASLAYNAVTSGRDVAVGKLYAGPFLRVDGTSLAYRRWGTHGTPILLLGGFVEPSWVWHAVGPLLARRHRVFAIDLPPFGFSERRGPYTLARWTQLVQGFAARLHLARPVVVGHSLGAAVVVRLGADDPQDVSGIVLLDGDALPGGGAGWLSNLLVPPWYTSGYRIVTGSDWIFRRALKSAWGSTRPLPNAVVDQFQRPFRVSGTAAAFKPLLGYGIQGVSPATLRRVRVRRLVLWGAQDSVDSVAAGRHTATLLHATFVAIPRAGHLSMLAAPTAVAQAIGVFATS
jgi:pimeloyl-ACP methyl ester carboxylesterase